jgi:hypothetical protein
MLTGPGTCNLKFVAVFPLKNGWFSPFYGFNTLVMYMRNDKV